MVIHTQVYPEQDEVHVAHVLRVHAPGGQIGSGSLKLPAYVYPPPAPSGAECQDTVRLAFFEIPYPEAALLRTRSLQGHFC